MKKILSNALLLAFVSFMFVVSANAQQVNPQGIYDINRYDNYDNDRGMTNYVNNSNLPRRVVDYIENSWRYMRISREQKINELQRIINLLNQKIRDLQNTNDRQRDTTATPTSGRAPLTVNFYSYYPSQGVRPTIDYGDGTNEQITTCTSWGGYGNNWNNNNWNNNWNNNNCSRPGVNTHVYRRPGTYSARIVQSFCPRGAQCFAAERVLETITIRVNQW